MRFGLNTFLVSSDFSDADLPHIEAFKSYGADVVELAIADPEAVSLPLLMEMLEQTARMPVVLCGVFGPGRDLRGSESEQLASVQYISDLIEIATLLGARVVCGPMYSSVGRASLRTQQEREQELALIVSHLKVLCAQAEVAGVCLAIEPLNRFETDCINTVEQAVDLIERVGSSALKIHIDTFHMNIEETDSSSVILEYGQHIGHVHASASHRGMLGQDHVAWDGVLSALQAIKYDGDIVIESFAANNETLAKAAAIWRPLYGNPEQLAVAGLSFLKSRWASLSSQVS